MTALKTTDGCRACQCATSGMNPIDPRDGLCRQCYEDFKFWCLDRSIEPRVAWLGGDTTTEVDFARADVQAAFNKWLEGLT